MTMHADLQVTRRPASSLVHSHEVHLHVVPNHMLDAAASTVRIQVHPNTPDSTFYPTTIDLSLPEAADVGIAIAKAITSLHTPKPYRHPAEGG